MPFDIHYFDTVGSTMDVARNHIQANPEADFVVIQGGVQEGGRGRRGNQWISPYGNLYQSIILNPKQPRQNWGQMSFVIAVALAEACLQTGVDQKALNLKWPNDVLIHGQKLAGILIEADTDTVIIGTGVNIEHAPDDRAKVHDFCDLSINDFRDVFLSHIEVFYSQWNEDGFAPIRDQWLSRAYRLNDTIQARVNHAVYDGVFENLDNDGTLILREKDGSMRKINAGEIIAC